MVKKEKSALVAELDEGKSTHKVRFEGEVLLKLDRDYRPLYLEVEVKD